MQRQSFSSRNTALWRDKQEIQHSADEESPPTFTVMIDNGYIDIFGSVTTFFFSASNHQKK
jgi:hypothetical protein